MYDNRNNGLREAITDNIIMSFGALSERKAKRLESELYVETYLDLLFEEKGQYVLRWHCGNKLEIIYRKPGTIGTSICSMNLDQFNGFKRETAEAITFILLTHTLFLRDKKKGGYLEN